MHRKAVSRSTRTHRTYNYAFASFYDFQLRFIAGIFHFSIIGIKGIEEVDQCKAIRNKTRQKTNPAREASILCADMGSKANDHTINIK